MAVSAVLAVQSRADMTIVIRSAKNWSGGKLEILLR